MPAHNRTATSGYQLASNEEADRERHDRERGGTPVTGTIGSAWNRRARLTWNERPVVYLLAYKRI